MLFIGECYVEFVLILYLFLLVISLLGLLYRWASMYLEFEARIPVLNKNMNCYPLPDTTT